MPRPAPKRPNPDTAPAAAADDDDAREGMRALAAAMLGPDRAGQLAALPVQDRAYALHLRGYTMREIARELSINKETANRYVRALERETAPWRKEARARWRRQAVAKLEHVQSAAWRRWDEVQDPMLLNTIASCEDKIGRIRGLYEQDLDEGAGGVTITIARRGVSGVSGGGMSAHIASAAVVGAGDGGDADQE